MAIVFVEARPKGKPDGSPIEDYIVEDHADHPLGRRSEVGKGAWAYAARGPSSPSQRQEKAGLASCVEGAVATKRAPTKSELSLLRLRLP